MFTIDSGNQSARGAAFCSSPIHRCIAAEGRMLMSLLLACFKPITMHIVIIFISNHKFVSQHNCIHQSVLFMKAVALWVLRHFTSETHFQLLNGRLFKKLNTKANSLCLLCEGAPTSEQRKNLCGDKNACNGFSVVATSHRAEAFCQAFLAEHKTFHRNN